jgi:hypothetical protein
MDTKKGFLIFLIIGIILIIISAIFCIFGYLIREILPAIANMYEIGIPYIIGDLGVIFFTLGGMFFSISLARKKNIV